MTRPLDDIDALFASLGMPRYPYRTFPALPAAGVLRPAEREGTDRRSVPLPTTRWRRDRDRTDIRRPERPGRSAPLRRIPGSEAKPLAPEPVLLPIP